MEALAKNSKILINIANGNTNATAYEIANRRVLYFYARMQMYMKTKKLNKFSSR